MIYNWQRLESRMHRHKHTHKHTNIKKTQLKNPQNIRAKQIYILNKHKKAVSLGWRTRWRRSRWMWSTSLSTDASGIHLQTQECTWNTSWVDRSTWPEEKNIHNHTKFGRTKELGGKTRVSRTGAALSGWGNWSRAMIRTLGQLSESEEKHLRQRVKRLICGSQNGMRIRQSLPQPYVLRTGTQVLWETQWEAGA